MLQGNYVYRSTKEEQGSERYLWIISERWTQHYIENAKRLFHVQEHTGQGHVAYEAICSMGGTGKRAALQSGSWLGSELRSLDSQDVLRYPANMPIYFGATGRCGLVEVKVARSLMFPAPH